MAATLAWVLGDRPGAPSLTPARELTARELRVERLHAEDIIEQATMPWMADRIPPGRYSEGVKFTISGLLGDTIVPPSDPVD